MMLPVKLSIVGFVLSLVVVPQDVGRVPIAPKPTPASARERALDGLRQATEALESWRAAAESGVAIDPEELRAVSGATEVFAKEMQALHGRLRAQEAARPKAERAGDESPSEPANLAKSSEIARAWADDARTRETCAWLAKDYGGHELEAKLKR